VPLAERYAQVSKLYGARGFLWPEPSSTWGSSSLPRIGRVRPNLCCSARSQLLRETPMERSCCANAHKSTPVGLSSQSQS
jgi:hypothetical protein